MKKILYVAAVLFLNTTGVFSQVQIDRPIDLNSATPGNARIMGIKQVSAPQDAVSAEALQSGSLIYALSGGSSSAYTLTLAPVLGAYTTGMEIRFKAHTANAAGAVTLKVNTLAAIPIKKDVSNNLDAGDIQQDQLVTVAYDGTNFQLISRTTDANSGGTVTSITASSPLTGGTITGSGTIGIPQANGSTNGYLGSGDWTNFNTAYTNRITFLTTTGSSGAATLSSNTLNVPNYTLSGLGGTPAARTLTINGSAFDLSADRSWSVGTVTSVSTAVANNGVTATWSMASPTPALTIGLGAITPTSVAASGTVTGSNLSGTNTGDQTLSGLGGVPTSRTLTINGTAFDLTSNRSWSVGTVTSAGLSLGTAGTDVNIGAGTSPVTSSGTITLNIPTASSSNRGVLSTTDWNTFNNKENALSFSTGLTRTGNTVTSNLSTGVAGGQTAVGGTAAGNNLTLSSTTNTTKGKILFGSSSYDEAANTLTIGTLTGTGNRAVYANASGTLVTATSLSTPTSCKEIKAANPMSTNGVYSIDPDGAGPGAAVPCYCDMTTNGGGWTKLNSAITTIASVSKGTAAWNTTNGEDIQGTGNSSGGCGGGGTNVMYTLSTPTVSFTQAYVLLTRTTSCLQCSNITAGTGGGYYSLPYRGTYTSSGMCQWSTPWVNGCCNPQSVAGLPTNWVLFSNASNTSLQYFTECSDASDNGAFTMQWFVR